MLTNVIHACINLQQYRKILYRKVELSIVRYQASQLLRVVDLTIISSVQSLSCVQLFATPWTAECQASLSITNSRSLLKPMSIKSVMPSNHLILCRALLLLPSIFTSTGSFPVSQLFTSGAQSIGVPASASLFPKNIQN